MTRLSEAPFSDGELYRHGRQACRRRDLFEWRPNDPFFAVMDVSGSYFGSSSTIFELVDVDGRRWPVFATDFCDLAMFGEISHGQVRSRWEVCRRGPNYGLRRVK